MPPILWSLASHPNPIAQGKHRRIIDGTLEDLASPAWTRRNAAITRIFDLLNDGQHVSVYHRARICGLLAKHGDEGDVEVTEYAIRCISHAQDILRNEELSDCSNARQAMVDLIMDARETLMVRSPDIDIPKDIMEAIYTPDSDSSTDSERLFETSSDEEDEEEEEEEQDNAMDVDADRTSSPRSILDTVQLPPTHILTPGFSSSAPVPELVELAFDVEPQNIRALGLVLTLLVTDNRGMVDNIFAFARTRGFSEEEIQEIITKAYVPKRVQAEGGDLGGDFTLRLKREG